MNRLDRDRKLLEQVSRGTLGPKVAAAQILAYGGSPIIAKRLRGRARYERRHAAPPRAGATPPSKKPGPSPRFLRAIALTAASVVRHRIAAENRAFAAATIDEAAAVPPGAWTDPAGVPPDTVLPIRVDKPILARFYPR